MEIWTGFTIGLLGSLHCVGMCGPIMLAIPWGYENRFEYISRRILYHFGRILTYTAMGSLSGLLGGTIAVAGYQNALSITLGVIIIAAFIIPARFRERMFDLIGVNAVFNRIKIYWATLFKIDSLLSTFILGILNGFLPCGLVYIALAGAISTGSVIAGISYMAAFGLGTTPILIALSFLGNIAGHKARRVIGRLIPAAAIVLATLLILRGLSLGIPYISPKAMTDSKGNTSMDCCHPAQSADETPAELGGK